MDTQRRVAEWLVKMGFEGEIPDSFLNVCNASTSFVWEQIINNAKPRQEIDHLKKNIIIHRLQKGSLNSFDEFTYPIEEIEVYKKKIELEKRIKLLEMNNMERNNKIENLSRNNKMKYIQIEILKQKIKEYEKKEFLLNTKANILGEDINKAEEALNFAKNLTPVEMEENPNTKEIAETLQKCAEKLEKLIQEMPQQYTRNNVTTNFHNSYLTTVKKQKTHTTLERYLNRSELQSGNKVHRKLKLSYEDKENKFSTNLLDVTYIPKTHESEQLLDKSFEVHTQNITGPKKTSLKGKRKESLGLLSDSCLNMENDDNDFLTANNDSLELPLKKIVFPDIQEDPFPFTPPRGNNCLLEPISRPETLVNANKTDFDSGLFSHSQHSYSSNLFSNKVKENDYKKLCYDKQLIETLQNLLYKNNRCIIWNSFQTINDNLLLDLRNTILQNGSIDSSNKKVDQDDIAKLNFLHVKTELQTMKHKAALKKLNEAIKKKKAILLAILSKRYSEEQLDGVRKILDLQLVDIGLDAILSCMKKEINASQKIQGNNDLQIVLRKVSLVKDQITIKLDLIHEYVEAIYKTLKSVSLTQEESVACVRRLCHFITDMSWANPLTENRPSKEVKLFEMFPLEFNKRLTYTDPKIFYRDLCTTSVPLNVNLNSNELYMITEIIESPFNPPETILLSLIKAKVKLNHLKSLPKPSRIPDFIKYSLDELNSQESYVDYAIDKLTSILNSSTTMKTLATASNMQKVIHIWLEMPVKNFISPKRTVDGQDYKYFERKYDEFCSSL